MKIESARNQIDYPRSIFIRSGESRFMTYCVKRNRWSFEVLTFEIESQCGFRPGVTLRRSEMFIDQPWLERPARFGGAE